jgi:hypothetical protein
MSVSAIFLEVILMAWSTKKKTMIPGMVDPMAKSKALKKPKKTKRLKK